MTPETWGQLWGLMCERFGKEPSADLAATYFDMLEARLSDAEIEHGVQVVLYEDTYWPSPSRIVEAAGGEEDAEARALEAWDKILLMAKDWRRAKPNEVLDDRGLRALRQVGTVKSLAMMNTDDLAFRRRDFISAFKVDTATDAEDHDALPSDKRSRKLIDDTASGLMLEDGEAA